jgi:hypothetical protein
LGAALEEGLSSAFFGTGFLPFALGGEAFFAALLRELPLLDFFRGIPEGGL